jgi:rare lipoprotein A
MNPSPVARPSRSLSEVLNRPVSGRHLVAGSLLLGLTTAGQLVASGLLQAGPVPATATATAPAPGAVAQAAVAPVVLARPVVGRASRGGARTALPATSFVVRTVPVGKPFTGLASWYGGAFQGRRTASGERFDTHALTAASRTLPFGTRLRVCRASRCVVVRVNDRGPFLSSRVLDLSGAARAALGYSGVARVTATPIGTRRVAVLRSTAAAPAFLAGTVPAVAPASPTALAPLRGAPNGSVGVLGAGLDGATALGLARERRRRS